MRRPLFVLAALAALATAAGCGPKPTPIDVPRLPGDGAEHVAKPPAARRANDPWAGRTDLITAPKPEPPAAMPLPPIEEYKLRNGLQVFVIKSDRLPVASVQLAIKAGRRHEPPSRLGVAELAADMLVKGTRRRSALAIAKAIDFVGGTIAADATFEATLVSCSVLARDLKTCLDLVPDMVTQPSFPTDELAKVRELALANVRRRLDDAGALASAHVQNLLWGNDHVRGRVISAESIAAIERDDLVAWHKAWFSPSNAMLVVAGDVDPKKVKADLERTFGRWTKRPVAPAPTYKEPGLSGSRIRLVDKPGQTQTHIRIAEFGIRHDDPRFFDSLVWNHVLGGGLTSRLMRVIRIEGGKAYGASSSFDRTLDRGSFVASTFTRNGEAVATTKLMLAEIARMAKEGPTQGEVAAAVAHLAGNYGLRFQAAADLGGALLTAELHGFGREYLANYPVAVGKVDVASAKQAASEILDPSAYVIVMVGDARELEPQLRAAGWKYQKVAFTAPISPPPVVPDAPIDPKAAAAAHQLVDAALAAKGGKAKLAAIKSLRMVATGTTTIGGQSVPVDIDRLFVLPDKMRLDATLAGRVKVTLAAAGKKGWQLAPDQTGQKSQLVDMQPADIAQVTFERWREPELILLKAADPAAKVWLAGDEKLDGKTYAVIKLRSPEGIELSLYLDKQTKLLARMSFRDGAALQTDTFSDYKPVGGINIAHKRVSNGAGRTTDLTLKTVEINPKYDPKVFDKPKTP